MFNKYAHNLHLARFKCYLNERRGSQFRDFRMGIERVKRGYLVINPVLPKSLCHVLAATISYVAKCGRTLLQREQTWNNVAKT